MEAFLQKLFSQLHAVRTSLAIEEGDHFVERCIFNST